MKGALIAALLFLAGPGWARQAWEKPRRDHVVFRFDPKINRSEPTAGLIPPWRNQDRPRSDQEIPVFRFLIESAKGKGFLLGTPSRTVHLESRTGVFKESDLRVDASTLFSRHGNYQIQADSHGHSYFKAVTSESQGQAFYRIAGFGNPISADERFLLSLNLPKREIQWLPIHAEDAEWKEEIFWKSPMLMEKDSGYIKGLLGVFAPWAKCVRTVSPRTVPLPSGLLVEGLEAGANAKAPWVMASVEGRDRAELMRWNPESSFWDFLHTFEGKGRLTQFHGLQDGSLAAAWVRAGGLDTFLSTVIWISSDGLKVVMVECAGQVRGLSGNAHSLGILTDSGLEIVDPSRRAKSRRYRLPSLSYLVYDAENQWFLASRSEAPWLIRSDQLWDLKSRNIRELKDPGPSRGEWNFAWTSDDRPLAVAQDCPDRITCIDLRKGSPVWQRDLPRGAHLLKVHPEAKVYLLTWTDGRGEVRDFSTGRLVWKFNPLAESENGSWQLDCLEGPPWLVTRITDRSNERENKAVGSVEIWDGVTGRRIAVIESDHAVASVAFGPKRGTWLLRGFGYSSDPAILRVVDGSGRSLWSTEDYSQSWWPTEPDPVGLWPLTSFETSDGIWVDPSLPRGMGLDPGRMILVSAKPPVIRHEVEESVEFRTYLGMKLMTTIRTTTQWAPRTLAILDAQGRQLMSMDSPTPAGFLISPKGQFALTRRVLAYPWGGMNCIYQDPVAPWVPLSEIQK